MLAAIGMLACAGRAHAAESVGIHAGLSVPTGELARSVGEGFHVGVSVAALNPNGGVGIDATYHVFAERTSEVPLIGTTILRERARLFEVALTFQGFLLPKTRGIAPYLKAGFGGHYVKADGVLTSQYFSVPINDSNWWPVLLAGVGFWMPLGERNGLCLEGLFHRTQSDNDVDFISVALAYRSRNKR